MARNENPPFPRGATFFGGDTNVINAVDGYQFEGQEWEFEDLDFSTGTIGSEAMRSNRRVRVRIVRNVSGATIFAGNLMQLNTNATGAPTPGQVIGQVSALGTVSTGSPTKAYPVDEWLPAAGCLANDLCYVVVDGYATIKTSSAGTTTIAVNGVVVCGVTGGAVAQDTTQTGAALFAQIQNAIGKAITAVGAASTAFVCDIGATDR